MALTVVVAHFWVARGFYAIYFAVSFFFVLSGFLLTIRHDFKRLSPRAYGLFMLSRAVRVVPVYWLVLAAVLAFGSYGLSASLPLHVLLLQSFVPSFDVAFSYTMAGWFLSSLMFCYLCFPLLRRWQQCGNSAVVAQAALVAAGLVALMCLLPRISMPSRAYWGYVFPPSRLIDFAVGMLAGVAFGKIRKIRLSVVQSTAVEIVALVVAVLALLAAYATPLGELYGAALLWLLPCVAIVLAFSTNGAGLVSRLLQCRHLLWLGRISYEVFMLQFAVGFGLQHVAVVLGWPVAVQAVATIAALLAASWLCHECVTVPVARWGSKVLGRLGAAKSKS